MATNDLPANIIPQIKLIVEGNPRPIDLWKQAHRTRSGYAGHLLKQSLWNGQTPLDVKWGPGLGGWLCICARRRVTACKPCVSTGNIGIRGKRGKRVAETATDLLGVSEPCRAVGRALHPFVLLA